jgi:enoyl-CoA hydratase/carnithine racemase
VSSNLRISDHRPSADSTDHETAGAVRVITFDRPEALNAFDTSLYQAAGAALDDARVDDNISVVVLTGVGRAFSAGQDLKEMAAMATAPPGEEIVSGFPTFVDALMAFDKPLMAAVNGLAIGIGFTMLPHCDLVLVSDEARFRTPFAELGVAPEAASSYLFPLVMGPQRGAHALFTGDWMSAAEAVECGIALSTHPNDDLMPATMALATRIAAYPLPSLRAIKSTVKAGRSDAIVAARAREEAEFARLLAGMVTGNWG